MGHSASFYFADSVSSFRYQSDTPFLRKNFDSHLRSYEIYTIMNSKWTTDLNIRVKAIKLLEDDMREILSDLSVPKDFVDALVLPTQLDT